MLWDYAENNVFGDAAGDYRVSLGSILRVLEYLNATNPGSVIQQDVKDLHLLYRPAISTDPPYYDNVGYADLSDFFYVWLRRCLRIIYPDLFTTLLVPKEAELIANPFRLGGSKEAANEHFESGFFRPFPGIEAAADSNYPLTVYYAFKQAESEEDEDDESELISISSGWETMLEGLVQAGFAINGTWPMRTELGNRMRNIGSNALASSIVLV